jgi:hypothetical protein
LCFIYFNNLVKYFSGARLRGCLTGADPGFQDKGAHFKKLRRAEEGTKIVVVFRVKNHHFTQKNLFQF